jgi:hypothetical protein
VACAMAVSLFSVCKATACAPHLQLALFLLNALWTPGSSSDRAHLAPSLEFHLGERVSLCEI